MATVFEWKITKMTVYAQVDQYTNVVNKVWYNCTASDLGISKTAVGILDIPLDTVEPFTAYENLTETEVLDWVWTLGVDRTAIETELDSAIHQPNNIVYPLPWE